MLVKCCTVIRLFREVWAMSDTKQNFCCVTPSSNILDIEQAEVQTQTSHYSLIHQTFIQMVELKIGHKGIHPCMINRSKNISAMHLNTRCDRT
jgi:hypothetical protein